MDDHVVIGRQLGLFLRLVERMYADLKVDGLDLDRAAYVLLGRIASEGPARLTTLADDVRLDLSTVSRQVAALEAAGLVARTTDSSDRRASVIEATQTGSATFARNRDIWYSTMRELLADWTPEERSQFAALFIRLNEKIADRGCVHGHTGKTAKAGPAASTTTVDVSGIAPTGSISVASSTRESQ
jgi:DNA-binding MarR family transcriptional regulator